MTTKSLHDVQIKDATKGIVTAVVSTFGVIDSDGDVTAKSTFTDGAPVVVSAYKHTSWDGALPVGRGVLNTTDTEAVATLQFFMDTAHGKATFDTIRQLGELQEWSYSLEKTVAHVGEVNGVEARFLDSTVVKEVSPVLRGASINTRTLAVKAEDEQKVTKFSEQADIALRGVKQLVQMALERLPLRAAEGKSIDEQISARDQLVAELAPLTAAIDDATQPPDDDEATREYLRFVAASLQGAA